MAMLLPMNVGNAEAELFEQVFRLVEEKGSQAERDEAALVRLQLERHGEYVRACERLEVFSDAMRAVVAPLVLLRFPMRLTEGTRASIRTGARRSFLRFLEDLHEAVVSQHALSDSCTDLPALLNHLANVLTLAQCNVLDGKTTHGDAVLQVVAHAEKARLAAVREESEVLLKLSAACEVVASVLRDFGRIMLTIGKSKVAKRFRALLVFAERRGLCAAGEVAVRHLCIDGLWLRGVDALNDAQLVQEWETLKQTHRRLADALAWEVRRVRWLVSCNSSNTCWCGVKLESGFVGSLVSPPAQMRQFATEDRVRVVREVNTQPFTCRLSAACVTNLLVELLHEGHLVLDKISRGYATRVLTFDFCKYEKVARHLLDVEVRPWVARMRNSH